MIQSAKLPPGQVWSAVVVLPCVVVVGPGCVVVGFEVVVVVGVALTVIILIDS